MNNRIYSTCIALLTLVVSFGNATNADDLPDEIAVALRRNANLLTISNVRWSYQRKINSDMHKRPECAELVSHINPGYWEPGSTEYSFDNGMYYVKNEFQSCGRIPFQRGWADIGESVTEFSFDRVKSYQPSERDFGAMPAIISILDMDEVRRKFPEFAMFEVDYFQSAGFELPRVFFDQRDPPEPTSLILNIIENECHLLTLSDIEIEDVACKKVDIQTASNRYTFILDPTLNYAVRQFQKLTAEGELLLSCANSKFQPISKGSKLYLPGSCSISIYKSRWFPKVHESHPIFDVEVELQTADTSQRPQELFDLTQYLRVGLHISDGDSVFTVSGGEKEVASMLESYSAQPASQSFRRKALTAIPVVNFVALFLLFIFGSQRMRTR